MTCHDYTVSYRPYSHVQDSKTKTTFGWLVQGNPCSGSAQVHESKMSSLFHGCIPQCLNDSRHHPEGRLSLELSFSRMTSVLILSEGYIKNLTSLSVHNADYASINKKSVTLIILTFLHDTNYYPPIMDYTFLGSLINICNFHPMFPPCVFLLPNLALVINQS